MSHSRRKRDKSEYVRNVLLPFLTIVQLFVFGLSLENERCIQYALDRIVNQFLKRGIGFQMAQESFQSARVAHGLLQVGLVSRTLEKPLTKPLSIGVRRPLFNSHPTRKPNVRQIF